MKLQVKERWVKVLRQNLYVHLDGISNSVLTKGIGHQDFDRYTIHRPKNLLLLDPSEESGDYEAHTGFRIIRGQENVDRYLSNLNYETRREIKWLDFEDYDALKRLTANEIAEILYLSHMKMQLRSPFFYKLQNDYAFFETQQEIMKVYYRNIDEFYQTLAQKISHKVLYQLNANRSLFSKRYNSILPLEIDTIKELKSIMQEGTVFEFSQVGLKDGEYHISVHVVEDNLRKIDSDRLFLEEKVGVLTYRHRDKIWEFKRVENAILY